MLLIQHVNVVSIRSSSTSFFAEDLPRLFPNSPSIAPDASRPILQ
jgi:hypothetical protein